MMASFSNSATFRHTNTMAKMDLKSSEYLNENFLIKSLENSLCSSDFNIKKYQITDLITEDGENYCSDIYQATIKYHIPDCEQEQEENFIIKSLPKHKQIVVKNLKIYTRELYFYKHILTKMETLMNSIVEKQWSLGPRLQYNTSDPIETLAFQNLTPLGFKLQSRQQGLDKAHSIMVLQKLAEYHALSMTLINQNNDLFTQILQRYNFGLLNMDSCKSNAFKTLFGGQLLKLIEMLKEDSEFQNVSKKLQQYYDQFTERVLKSVYPLKGQLNVLNHGDLWINNLMFRYDNNNQMPKEVSFIDFQLCFYGSLGFDINYFFNTSVQLEVLQKHRWDLIDVYTNTLQQTFEKLPASKKSSVSPTKEQILQEIKDKEAYGFFVAYGFFPLMSMSSKDCQGNSLEKLNERTFAEQKIQLMFSSNKRTIDTLKYTVKRLEQLKVL